MSGNSRPWVGLGLICACLAGCSQPTARLNSPPQGFAEHRSELQPIYTYMTDNAMISDMSITDIHFVPHTTELNSLGAERLARLARLIEVYGGTVRYATESADQELVNERVEHARDFLAAAGADMNRVSVTVAMAGANYTLASDAIEAKQKGMSSIIEPTGEER